MVDDKSLSPAIVTFCQMLRSKAAKATKDGNKLDPKKHRDTRAIFFTEARVYEEVATMLERHAEAFDALLVPNLMELCARFTVVRSVDLERGLVDCAEVDIPQTKIKEVLARRHAGSLEESALLRLKKHIAVVGLEEVLDAFEQEEKKRG